MKGIDNYISYSFKTKLHNNEKSQKDLAQIHTNIVQNDNVMDIVVKNIENRNRLTKPIVTIFLNQRLIFEGDIKSLSDILAY